MPIRNTQLSPVPALTTTPASMTVTTAQLQLQASLIEAMSGLVDLVARLSQQLPAATTSQSVAAANAEPWRELIEALNQIQCIGAAEL